MIVKIPPQVDSILQILTQSGFDACVVGGCVRDGLLRKIPSDWDIATSALPEEAMNVLGGFSIIKTGLRHGTVTVLAGGTPVEVTTYRIDGTYSDGRRPDTVTFTRLLREDLSRRDFTVNAMACRRTGELVDEFGGRDDLARGIIRCVGNPDLRFREDGLRILRALRFASVLNFTIEPETSGSLFKNRGMLDGIARERIAAEFTKLLCGTGAERVLREYREVIAQFIPESRPSFDFPQNNPHHAYDVWEHTLRGVGSIAPDPVLRLTMFLHDLGKPFCYSEDRDGTGHFYGHAEKSAELAETILKRLRYSRKVTGSVILLVKEHDLSLPDSEKVLRRRLNRLGEENLRRLIEVRVADTLAKSPEDRAKLPLLKRTAEVLDQILQEKQCFSLHNLAVNGNDLIEAGFPEGSEIGRLLSLLLNAVMDGTCRNCRAELLDYAAKAKGGEPLMERVVHPLEPVWDAHSRVLVLGTMPSPKSREYGFYYSHPQNRFWRIIADLYGLPLPKTNDEKRAILLSCGIALWDVLKSCVIEGADDGSIREPVPNDIAGLLSRTGIRSVFTTGAKAATLYRRLCLKETGIPAVALPSTSPANCRFYSYEKLLEAYQVLREAADSSIPFSSHAPDPSEAVR